MTRLDLNKVKLGYSGLTQSIYLYRHGKKVHEALDNRNADKDVMAVITDKMMDNAKNGSSLDYRFGEQWYRLTVEKIKEPDVK
jgi:hypothetical protein